jgi:hypothetical protein
MIAFSRTPAFLEEATNTQNPMMPNTAVYNNISSKQHANILQARPRESDVLLG